MKEQRRIKILEIVNTPIAFYVLLLLIGESFFILAYINSDEPHKTILLWAFIFIILSFIVLISVMSIIYPGALYGKNASDEYKSKEQFLQLKLEYLKNEIKKVDLESRLNSENRILKFSSFILAFSVPAVFISLYFLIYTFALQSQFDNYKYETYTTLVNFFHKIFYILTILFTLIISYIRKLQSLTLEKLSHILIISFSSFWLVDSSNNFDLNSGINLSISFIISGFVYLIATVNIRQFIFKDSIRIKFLGFTFISLLLLIFLIFFKSNYKDSLIIDYLILNETDKELFILEKNNISIDSIGNKSLIDSLMRKYNGGIPIAGNILSDLPVEQTVTLRLEAINVGNKKKVGSFKLNIQSEYLISNPTYKFDFFIDKYNRKIDYLPPFPNSVFLSTKLKNLSGLNQPEFIELVFQSYITSNEKIKLKIEFFNDKKLLEFEKILSLSVTQKSKNDYFEKYMKNATIQNVEE